MATLSVTLTEDLTLNGYQQGGTNSFTIASITQAFKRIITVEASNDATVLTFGATVHAAAGAQDVGSVKYIRITNLDSSNSVTLGMVGASDNFQLVLAAGQSFVMGSPDDCMLGETDTSPAFASLEDLATVVVDTAANAVQLEVFTAAITTA